MDQSLRGDLSRQIPLGCRSTLSISPGKARRSQLPKYFQYTGVGIINKGLTRIKGSTRLPELENRGSLVKRQLGGNGEWFQAFCVLTDCLGPFCVRTNGLPMWYSEGAAKFQRRSPAGVRVGYSTNDCASGLGRNDVVK